MSAVRLAVVGTRVLACSGDRHRAARRVFQAIRRLRPEVVISGGAEGVDAIAEMVAISEGYGGRRLLIHRPTTRAFHGPGGYRERDALIAAECTHLLRIACVKAKTYGSGWTADEAERLGRTVVRVQACPPARAG